MEYEVNGSPVYGKMDFMFCIVFKVFPVELEKPFIKMECNRCEREVYTPKMKPKNLWCPHCGNRFVLSHPGDFSPLYHYVIEAIIGLDVHNENHIFLHFFDASPNISLSKGDLLSVKGTLGYVEKGKKIQDILLLGSFEKTSNKLDELIDFEEINSEKDDESGVDRRSPEYKDWRNEVIFRDRKCVCCGLDKHLEAHHLFGYKDNKSLRVDVNNGVTLCSFCHNKYHSVYGYDDVNPVDFVKFMSRYGV